MKIVIIVSSRNMQYGGGMNRVIYNALPALNDTFDEVIIVSGKSIFELFRGLFKIAISNPFKIDYFIFNSLSSIRISHNKYWYIYSSISKLLNIKKAIYWHEMPEYFKNFSLNPIYKKDVLLINKHLKNKNYLHLAVSKASSKMAYFFNKKPNLGIVYNAIIERSENALLYNKFTIVTVGSIQNIKGTDIWTDVAIEVCKKNANAQFVWCGGIHDKHLYQDCLLKIVKNNFSKRIIFLGHTEDASIVTSASHLYFSSSRLDSFPLSVIEAMSVGRNIIYYDSGGIKEAVENNGYFIDNFDVYATANVILTKINKFETNNYEVFNSEIYERFKNNFTSENFVEKLKKELQNFKSQN